MSFSRAFGVGTGDVKSRQNTTRKLSQTTMSSPSTMRKTTRTGAATYPLKTQSEDRTARRMTTTITNTKTKRSTVRKKSAPAVSLEQETPLENCGVQEESVLSPSISLRKYLQTLARVGVIPEGSEGDNRWQPDTDEVPVYEPLTPVELTSPRRWLEKPPGKRSAKTGKVRLMSYSDLELEKPIGHTLKSDTKLRSASSRDTHQENAPTSLASRFECELSEEVPCSLRCEPYQPNVAALSEVRLECAPNLSLPICESPNVDTETSNLPYRRKHILDQPGISGVGTGTFPTNEEVQRQTFYEQGEVEIPCGERHELVFPQRTTHQTETGYQNTPRTKDATSQATNIGKISSPGIFQSTSNGVESPTLLNKCFQEQVESSPNLCGSLQRQTLGTTPGELGGQSQQQEKINFTFGVPEFNQTFEPAECLLLLNESNTNIRPGELQTRQDVLKDAFTYPRCLLQNADSSVTTKHNLENYRGIHYPHQIVAPEITYHSHQDIRDQNASIPYTPEQPAFQDERNVVCEPKAKSPLCAMTSFPENTKNEEILQKIIEEEQVSFQEQQVDLVNHNSGDSNFFPCGKPASHCATQHMCPQNSCQEIHPRFGHSRSSCQAVPVENWLCRDHGDRPQHNLGCRQSIGHVFGDSDAGHKHSTCHNNLSDPWMHRPGCGVTSESSFDSNHVIPVPTTDKRCQGVKVAQMQLGWKTSLECWRNSSRVTVCNTHCPYSRAGSSPQNRHLRNMSPSPTSCLGEPIVCPSNTQLSCPSSSSLENIGAESSQIENPDGSTPNDCQQSGCCSDGEKSSLEGDIESATPLSMTHSDFELLLPPEHESQDVADSYLDPGVGADPNPATPTPGLNTMVFNPDTDKAFKGDAAIATPMPLPEDIVQSMRENSLAGNTVKTVTPFTLSGQPESQPNILSSAFPGIHGDEAGSLSDDEAEDADEPGHAGDSIDREGNVSSASSTDAGISDNETPDFSAVSNIHRGAIFSIPTNMSRVSGGNIRVVPVILSACFALSVGLYLVYQNQVY